VSSNMNEFLTFQLYGPMASWGEIAVGEERDTAMHPTRTAVLGLCAAALGIERGEELRIDGLNASLGFAVCVRCPGHILRDFHTIQTPSGKRARDLPTRADELNYRKVGTTLSKRHYLVDAHYTVCLWLRDDEPALDLGTLADALRRPGFTLFLGRKSCPLALPMNPVVAQHSSIAEALRSYPHNSWLAPLEDERVPHVHVYWDAETHGVEPGIDAIQEAKRWDRLVSRQRWQFARRDEALGRLFPTEETN